MEKNNSSLEQLKAFLNKLFQFESQDLDFGVYKILHYRHNEIKQFINELLVDTVQKSLKTLTDAQIGEARDRLADLSQDDIVKGWLDADEVEKKTLEKFGKEKIKQYKELKNQVDSVQVSVDTENQIYNHLTIFFSRYYDTGDFVSKRRFGKNEKYMVPYNGEETHFYWANHDQYYIKSSETFQKFSFRSGPHKSDLTVHFKLTDAQTEQGNVKADASKYFMLSEKEPALNPDEINIFFEYRPLSDDEKKAVGTKNIQEKLNEQAVKRLESRLKKHAPAAGLWEIENEQTLLFRKLQHYTKKNQYDFFIHKNLKGFLERELDFYIKSELVSVDDLYVSETDFHLERIRHNFKTIKVFKEIADTIIVFLTQIEEYQKKLWEKKKFVLSTQWVITIDRLVKYVGIDAATPILAEVIQNKNQIAEWQWLFGKKIIPTGKLTINSLKSDLFGWMRLPIDTVHFSKAFKENLLNVLSEKIDLENEADGLVLHSDNFHGLNTVNTKFNGKIKCIHIDPPYNTATSGFLYKNEYKHASWLSMMEDRILLSINLLSHGASFQCHIDENEYEYLHKLISKYPLLNAGPVIWDKRNPMNGGSGVATQHEYIIWRINGNQTIYTKNTNILEMLSKVEELKEAEGEINDNVRSNYSKWLSKNKSLSGGEKAYRYIDDEGNIYQSVSLRAPEPRFDEKFHLPLIHPKTKKACSVPPNGFSRTPETLQKMIQNGEIIFGNDETTQPRQKVFLTEGTRKQFTSIYQDGKKGKADTKPLGLDFPYCHPTSLYTELIGACDLSKNDFVIDFFAGSGTTFHAVQLLNQEDDGKRKCILIEQGDYVYSIVIPRIKKIAYTFEWKTGKPKDDKMNGLGVFFKYQRLEQYEESLENISYTASTDTTQMALQLEEYIPKYFLEFETRGSQSIVNTEAMSDPWNYDLKVWDGLTYDTRQAVDLVETFNYLIGLHMQKCITKEINGQKYQMVYGTTNGGKQALVIWRRTENWQIKDYEADRDALTAEISAFPHDLLYINGQAHIDGYEPIEHIFKNKMVS